MWRVKKNWDENKMAEIDWIQGFMKRHVYLSMLLLKIIKTGITGVGTRGAGTSEFGITE
jgi:hypothetical protein